MSHFKPIADGTSFAAARARAGSWLVGRGESGFTILEVIVASAISMTFLAALYSGFLQILSTADQADARVEALRNAQAAIATLTDELKTINTSGANIFLIGTNAARTFGNGFDEDGDGDVDEELLNGRDDDGDWDPATDDLHVPLPGFPVLADRFAFTAQPPLGALFGIDADDLGDFHVDEDVRFGADALTFQITLAAAAPNVVLRQITYGITDFDGQRFVLVRESRTEFSDAPPVVTTAPLAFGVLGFDLLYWDPNGDPDPGSTRETRPYWVQTWNSDNVATFDPPGSPLPASIYVRVTVYADGIPFELYNDGQLVRTLQMQTVINVEEIIGSASYPRANL